jgi:hypothetical protein
LDGLKNYVVNAIIGDGASPPLATISMLPIQVDDVLKAQAILE